MGTFLWKSLSRPWEVVGASCTWELWQSLRGDVGLAGRSDTS